MEVIQIIAHIFTFLLFIYIAYSALYIFIFGFAGIFYRDPKNIQQSYHTIAVLIPGYKEDDVIVEVARQALSQNYPQDKFDVVVIADSFLPQTLERLKALEIKLIEVSFEKSTKAKALNKALDELAAKYDVALVLDADNVMADDFLARINNAYASGAEVMQAHRLAKNTNTSFAILDAVSEEVNNHIFRKGHRVLGLSAALIGSGMAFDYHLFKKYMSRITAVGGFDKELEMNLLRDGHVIHYLNEALVYDEKIQKSDHFEGQRRRWLSAQFIYFARFLGSSVRGLFVHGNIDFFDKVLQMALLPRILLLGLSGLSMILLGIPALFFPTGDWQLWIFPPFNYWLIMVAVVFATFVFSIPGSFFNSSTLKAIGTLPKGIFLMALSLIRIKGANKQFIHTQHGTSD